MKVHVVGEWRDGRSKPLIAFTNATRAGMHALHLQKKLAGIPSRVAGWLQGIKTVRYTVTPVELVEGDGDD